MTRDEVYAALRLAVEDECGHAAVLEDATTAASVEGWDSLAHARIVMNLEARLDVDIDMDRTYRMATVGDLVDLVAG